MQLFHWFTYYLSFPLEYMFLMSKAHAYPILSTVFPRQVWVPGTWQVLDKDWWNEWPVVSLILLPTLGTKRKGLRTFVISMYPFIVYKEPTHMLSIFKIQIRLYTSILDVNIIILQIYPSRNNVCSKHRIPKGIKIKVYLHPTFWYLYK